MLFTIIIPVYNRPDEVYDLLTSLTKQNFNQKFETLIVEDGSSKDCKDVVKTFEDFLDISYYFKENSGPGDSRNYAMQRAKGDYFLLVDSDCILPNNYLQEIEKSLNQNYADCFGGVDTAMDSFSDLQKAISYSMTSLLTTGGIRGGSEKLGKFQPRSFNMGMSRQTFEKTQGFRQIYIGEDTDFSLRLREMGLTTRLFSNVKVFHKRRISWSKFFKQVNNFGKARPILDKWHPGSFKITFMFPAFFVLGLLAAIILCALGRFELLGFYIFYLLLCFIDSSQKNKSMKIGWMTLRAILTQFLGYGTGYLLSYWKITICHQKPENAFPELFVREK